MEQTQYLDQQGRKIAYDISGSGPLVVCSPSLGDLRGEYRYLIPKLIENGYRAASMDVRGHGETSPHWPDYSVAGVGSDMLTLARHLDNGPAFLIGTSMSAGAAVWAAAEEPDLVAGLILIGPFVRGETNLQNRLLFSVLFARPWGPSAWLKYFSTLFPTRKPQDYQTYTTRLKSNLAEKGRLEAVREMMNASKAASEARLERVTTPTLIIMGSKDPDFKNPAGEAQEIAAILNGQVQIIEDAGHYPHVEMPELTAPAVLSFLGQVQETKEPSYVE
jgi:pimeloyl-ACP methyl ester carboxylesterase